MDRLLTPEEVAEQLQVAVKTVKDWLRAGKLRGIKMGQLWRVEPEALDEYLNRQRIAQQMELEAKVSKESAKRIRQGGSYAVHGFGCEECGHNFILDISFTELMEKVAEGEILLCPNCGEGVETDFFTPERARGHLERQEELRKEYGAEEAEKHDNKS
jgi:excisionase family DNA binding protein